MVNVNELVDELVIVGIRHGEFADALRPFFADGNTMKVTDLIDAIGGSDVYLMPVNNRFDEYAVGVFNADQKFVGYLWMCQSYPLCKWMVEHRMHYVRAKLTATYMNMATAVSDVPLHLQDFRRQNSNLDMHWAEMLPEVLATKEDQRLGLCIDMLRHELMVAVKWNKQLEKHIDTLLAYLPVDLSGHRYNESIEVFMLMKNSPIKEVRDLSGIVLNSYVKLGSKEQMTWWINEWLPVYEKRVEEHQLVTVFEAEGIMLKDVERMLNNAPCHLYSIYRTEKWRFAKRLYYSSLPYDIYNRLMTLLAVREVMVKKRQDNPVCEKKPNDNIKEKTPMNVTNNFNAPVGQHIDHVDNVYLQMDRDGSFHFGQVENIEVKLPSPEKMVEVCYSTAEEGLWWGHTGWAIVYRIYQMCGYNGRVAQFIRDVESWPFTKTFNYRCNKDSVGKPLQRGCISGELEEWLADGAQKQEYILGKRLKALLSPFFSK